MNIKPIYKKANTHQLLFSVLCQRNTQPLRGYANLEVTAGGVHEK